MSEIKVAVLNRKTGNEVLFGGEHLPVVFPYGLGPTYSTIEEELGKISTAKILRADMVKDNTIGRKEWAELIKSVRRETDLCVGASATITAANIAFSREGKARANPREEDFYNAFEELSNHCDAIEVFPTITSESLEMVRASDRVMKSSISRAGDIITRYMNVAGKENPFYQDFSWFLRRAKENDITLILGNGFRAGCIHDSLDTMQMYEVERMKEFSELAIKWGVRIIAGVYGHVMSDEGKFEEIRSKLRIPTGGLGPLLTDIAAGYDHINAAIGIITLRKYIDWVSLITPAEHMGLPTPQDGQDGMAAVNLARHILDLRRGEGQAEDLEMSKAREDLDWEAMRERSIDPCNARWENTKHEKGSPCTLCGAYCPLIPKGEKNE
jgi:phosphomethylpyrimidine synthase